MLLQRCTIEGQSRNSCDHRIQINRWAQAEHKKWPYLLRKGYAKCHQMKQFAKAFSPSVIVHCKNKHCTTSKSQLVQWVSLIWSDKHMARLMGRGQKVSWSRVRPECGCPWLWNSWRFCWQSVLKTMKSLFSSSKLSGSAAHCLSAGCASGEGWSRWT